MQQHAPGRAKRLLIALVGSSTQLFIVASMMHAQTAWAGGATLADPYATSDAVSSTQAKDLLGSANAPQDCNFAFPSGTVDLLQAAERAICHNPKTRQAWADVKAKAAQLGAASGAYLPTVNATLRSSVDHNVVDVTDQPFLSSDQRTTFRDYTLALSWKLLDFGGMKAQGEYATQSLLAAQAAHDDALQGVLATTVKDYYAAVAAQSAVEAATGTEDDARRSLQAAKARYQGGVAAIIDQMQAQTEFAQAVFNRAKAAGDLKISQGVLALDMGLNPNVHLSLPSLGDDVRADVGLDKSIDELIEEARRLHPKSLEARAQLQAALARVETARAQGQPSLSLNVRINNNTQPVTPAVGISPVPASGRDRFIGVQLDVPLFEGYATSYAVRSAQAVVEGQEANVRDVEQQVTLNVWSTFASLEADTENIRYTAVLLDSAQQTYVAAQQRYQKGVGSILELLTAQSSLGAARQTRVQSLVDWRTARLQLAASLGRLSLLGLK